MTTASRDLEVSLARRWGIVAGMDEVGRGALAGPVAVGVALVSVEAEPVPEGLTDSKALSPRRREALVEPVRSWALDSSVGYASPREIDQWGIIAALRLAGRRALADVASRGLGMSRAMVRGPMLPGIVSAWEPQDGPAAGVPYIVFAGNVGDDSSLAAVVATLNAGIGSR